jgi:YD repeat-containing protein
MLVKVTTYDNGTPEYYTQYYFDSLGNTLRMYTGLSSPLTISGLDNVNGSDTSYCVTRYAYNRFSQMTSMTDPLSQTESYTYDINGNLLEKTDRSGNVTTYAYDDLGRLTSSEADTPDGAGDASVSVTYTFAGLKRSDGNASGTTLYTYDSLGRVTQEAFSGSTVNSVKNYTYNIGGSRTSFAVSANGTQLFNTTYRMTR